MVLYSLQKQQKRLVLKILEILEIHRLLQNVSMEQTFEYNNTLPRLYRNVNKMSKS